MISSHEAYFLTHTHQPNLIFLLSRIIYLLCVCADWMWKVVEKASITMEIVLWIGSWIRLNHFVATQFGARKILLQWTSAKTPCAHLQRIFIVRVHQHGRTFFRRSVLNEHVQRACYTLNVGLHVTNRNQTKSFMQHLISSLTSIWPTQTHEIYEFNCELKK